MPIDPITGGMILSLGSQAVGQGYNIFSQNQQNQYNQQQQQQQQNWNLQNQQNQQQWNLDQWNRQNLYNSPQAQMARFKAAGLNPHLIYGKGSSGPAATITSPDVKPYTRSEASNVNRGLDLFGQYNHFKQIQAQTDNTRQATSLSKQEELLKAIQTANTATAGSHAKLNYGIAKELRETSINAATENLAKLQAETRRTSQEADFAIKTSSNREKKIAAELENLLKEGRTKDLKNKLLKWEVQLSKQGYTKQDSPILRQIEHYKNILLKQAKKGKKSYDWYKNFLTKKSK